MGQDNRDLTVGNFITTWRTASFYKHDKLSEGLTTLGLEKFIPALSTNDANLRYSLEQKFNESALMVRSMQKGFAVVREIRGDENERKNEYRHEYAFWLEGDNKDRLRMDPYNEEVAKSVVSYFAQYCSYVTGTNATKAMVHLVGHLKGTTLRPSGGVYSIFDTQLMTWKRIASVFERAAAIGECKVYVIRHKLDPDSIKAIHDALAEEIKAEMGDTENFLAPDTDGKTPGERALKNRGEQILAMKQKVEMYANILGLSNNDLLTQLEELKGRVGMAGLAITAAKKREATANAG